MELRRIGEQDFHSSQPPIIMIKFLIITALATLTFASCAGTSLRYYGRFLDIVIIPKAIPVHPAK